MKPSIVIIAVLLGGTAVAAWDGNLALAGLLAAAAAVAVAVKGLAVVAGQNRVVAGAGGRRRPGFCRRCGYCLHGNTSGACPECGTRTAPGRDGSPVPAGTTADHFEIQRDL